MEIKSLKSISYRIYAFFIGLLGLSLLSIVFFTSNYAPRQDIGTEVPNIGISDFTLYLMSLSYLQAVSSGYKAMRYNDYEEIYELHFHQYNPQNANEYIYSPFVVSKNSLYTFPQGADYIREDSVYFWSAQGVYDYKKRIFEGKGDFKMTNQSNRINGQNIYYNAFDEHIRADSIKAIFKEKI